MSEEWRTIEDHPNYSVSNLGRVRNDKTGKLLKPHKSNKENGYYRVTLFQATRESRKNFLIHRLVAMAFIPNPDNKKEVNHIDGDKFNNVVSNLEWVSPSENCLHAHRVLNCKSPAKKVIRIEDSQVFDSIAEATYACGLKNSSSISLCLSGRWHTAGGYHWRYFE